MRLFAITAMLLAMLVLGGCTATDQEPSPGDGLHKTAPGVVGLTVEQATTQIEEAGYEVGTVKSQASQEATPGSVIAQDPVEGTSVPRGEPINLITAE